MDGGEIVISLRGVSLTYPHSTERAVGDLSLDLRRGEWTALLGNNGSGKSTLAKMINALLIPTQGACIVCGIDTSDESRVIELRQKVSMVFQDPDDQIVASIVEEEVAFGPENLALPPEEIEERVSEALKTVGLTELRMAGSYALSGGQKQRLALAGAIAMRPQILVLDESTSMLDPEGRSELLACIKKMNDAGMTVIQITHRMDEVAFADRVAVMSRGMIAWEGTRRDFFDGPARELGFEESGLMKLHRVLKENGLINSDEPDVDRMLEEICL